MTRSTAPSTTSSSSTRPRLQVRPGGPIVRVGEGGGRGRRRAGHGTGQQVRTVEAVAELELSVGDLRGRALLPTTTQRELTSTVRGVSGVGISANIKFPI